MTEGKFTLKDSAEIYPDAGFDPGEDHFVVMLGAAEVGVIYRIGEEWVWSITLAGMPPSGGHADARRAAREAFRAAWDAQVARLGQAHVERALAAAGVSPSS